MNTACSTRRVWVSFRKWTLSSAAGFWMCLLGGTLGTASLSSATGITLQATPPGIPWNTNAWVTLAVSNVSPASAIQLELYLDVQNNGLVDAADQLLTSYRVQDGVTNALGSAMIVDDEDGVADGTIISRVSYFGIDNLLHTVGPYLWQARVIALGNTATASFTVTQPTSTVWITGAVIDYVTSNPVPGAIVSLECFDDTLATPIVWSGTNGAFKVYLPAGVSTADVSGVVALGLGYFNPEVDESEKTPVAGYEYSNNLTPGENPLPIALRVVPKVPDMICEVTGHIYDDLTNALPGVVVNIEWNDEDDGSATITDSNGMYRVCMPPSTNATYYADPTPLMYLGLVAVGEQRVVTNDVTGADLYCHRATLLASGSVRAADDNAPVVGAVIEMGGDRLGAGGVTFEDGKFQVGVIPYPNYSVNEDNFDMLGLAEGTPIENLSITDNSCTNLDFRPERTFPLSGIVYDIFTNRVTGGVAGTFRYPSSGNFWQWEFNTRLNRIGEYRLVIPTGQWAVVVANVPGCVGVVYPNYSYPEWDNNHIADPVTNGNGGIDGVDFYLARTTRIEGHVLDNTNGPLLGIAVSAWNIDRDNWQMRGNGLTDASGFYSLEVPPGSNYVVEVSGQTNGGKFWVRQLYDHESDTMMADPVAAYFDVPATNIDFQLDPGGALRGHVVAAVGGLPVADCPVEAASLDGTSNYSNWTDDNGYFEIIVPAGTYTVEARPDWENLLYARQYFSNVVSRDEAVHLAVQTNSVVQNVDFTLDLAGSISGHIFIGEGVPLENCHVGAEDTTTGERIAEDDTAADGSYTLVLPGGFYRIRALPTDQGLPYLDMYYSNTLNSADAVEIWVTGTNATTGIDFTLSAPSIFEGRITDKNSGLPVVGISVSAMSIPDTNEFWNNWSYYRGSPTDSNGYYTVQVPPGPHYIISANSGSSFYLGLCWSNRADYMQANLVSIGVTSTVSNIDFALETGGRISGHVYREDTGLPLASCAVSAMEFVSGDWVAGGQTDESGYYSLALSAGLSYRVQALPSQNWLPYADEWYDDTTNAAATPVAVLRTNVTGGIDFSLMVTDLDFASWQGHYFTTSELGNPAISGDSSDPDNDGADNASEYAADTDPRRSNSVLRITGNHWSAGAGSVDWIGGRWARQYMQRCDNLFSNEWVDVYTNDALPTTLSNTVMDSAAGPASSFFRIRTER